MRADPQLADCFAHIERFYEFRCTQVDCHHVHKAIELYEKAIELNPQWFPTYRDLAYSTKQVSGAGAAVELLEDYIEEHPDAPGVPYARQTIKEIE